jgi:hypothetical protein
MKKWITAAVAMLDTSLGQVPHELNELDWKQSLSPKKDRLAQHLSAFANHPNGGVLVFGIDDQTATPLLEPPAIPAPQPPPFPIHEKRVRERVRPGVEITF